MTVATSQRLCGKCGATPSGDAKLCSACGGAVVAMRAPDDALIGKVLDERFEIRSLLGVGGMGTVYRAYQRSTDREVAIKVIDPRQMTDVNAVRRFLREAKLASKLSHPNTVSVFDFGQSAEGYLYLVMELVKGRTLSALIREQPVGFESAVRIAEQLCDALEAAHTQSIIHRDLKPANVMVLDDPPGRDLVKVLDFGIAKNPESDITEVGLLVGTPRYMSPQVLAGAEACADSDLYALGVLLVEITTRRSPYSTKGVHDLISQKLVSPVLPAGVPSSLRPIIERLLDPDQARRFASAAELRQALGTLRGPAQPEPRSERAPTVETTTVVTAPVLGGAATLPAPAVAESSPDVTAAPPQTSPIAPRRRWGALAAAATTFVALVVTAGVLLARDTRDDTPARATEPPSPPALPPREPTATLPPPPPTVAATPPGAATPPAATTQAITTQAAEAPAVAPPPDRSAGSTTHRSRSRKHNAARPTAESPTKTGAAKPTADSPTKPGAATKPAAPVAAPVDPCKQKPRPADCAPF